MTEIKVDIESLDLDEYFIKIDELQERLKNEKGVNWHSYSYFHNTGEGFWRFDWEYIWDRTNSDLEPLLKEAIDFAEMWLK